MSKSVPNMGIQSRFLLIWKPKIIATQKDRKATSYSNSSLVGGIPTPLKNMSSSVGIIIPNIWKNKISTVVFFWDYYRSSMTFPIHISRCSRTGKPWRKQSLGLLKKDDHKFRDGLPGFLSCLFQFFPISIYIYIYIENFCPLSSHNWPFRHP